jgi:hypothetical protein
MPLVSARALALAARLARRKAMLRSHRLFLCSYCTVLVRVCLPCDRGQRCCSSSCSAAVRRRSLRLAGQQYQRTELGRARHAARQRAYRLRQRLAVVAPLPQPSPLAPNPSGLLLGALPSAAPALPGVPPLMLPASAADFILRLDSPAIPPSLPPPLVTAAQPRLSSLAFSCCHRCGANPSVWLRCGPLSDNRLLPLRRRRRGRMPAAPP